MALRDSASFVMLFDLEVMTLSQLTVAGNGVANSILWPLNPDLQ